MSFLLKWLKPQTTARIGLRPHRSVEFRGGIDAAHALVLRTIEVTLGANVYVDDRKTNTIEAGFGLVNNERVRVSLEPQSDAVTVIRIEAFYPAGVQAPEKSAAVEVLADTLRQSEREA